MEIEYFTDFAKN